jgi:tRNA-dihydrouridine synthase A
MMDWTDRHCRAFHRGFGPHTVLYTEMVHARALIHGDAEGLLAFDPVEHPVALQLGGSEPAELARAARIGVDAGYDEINLNVGCPSDRVASGNFGACLMAEPERVADAVAAMRAAVDVPVTVKCRLGIEGADVDPALGAEDAIDAFVDTVASGGCTLFVIHARNAVLGGLSPKENREIPPLRHERVAALARRRPDLEIVVNGGLATVDDVRSRLGVTDGVMIGREAYQRPMILDELHAALFGGEPIGDPARLLAMLRPYLAARLAEGVPLTRMSRHLLGLFHGRPGARAFRRHVSEHAHRRGAGLEVLDAALARTRPAAEAA